MKSNVLDNPGMNGVKVNMSEDYVHFLYLEIYLNWDRNISGCAILMFFKHETTIAMLYCAINTWLEVYKCQMFIVNMKRTCSDFQSKF